MSAFIVEQKCIENVLYGIWVVADTSDYLKRDDKYRLSEDSEWFTLQQWGDQLIELNTEAVNQRYAQDSNVAEKFKYGSDCRDILGGMVQVPQPCRLIQAYKSLQCLLYQCSEGTVPERGLFKQLQELQNNLAAKIIRALPEYATSRWGG